MANKFMNGFDKSDVSSEEAWELYLFSVNDGDLYRQKIEPILANLKKKIKKGTYDETLALKQWRYAADDGAQKYTKEYDTPRHGSSFGIFTVAMRKEVALLMQSHYEDELRYAKNPSGDSSVRSPTSTSSDVRSPTRTSTKAHTTGNFTATVTGGAGRGANTVVNLYPGARKTNPRADGWIKKGRAYCRLKFMIEPPVAGRVMSPDKWLLLYRPSLGVTEAIGAFTSARGAKEFADTRRLSIEGKYKRRAKNPSARLVHRRKINTKRGYFPNPLKDKIALHFNAGNNTNGNPRRVFVVVNTQGEVVGAYDEGYRGEASVTQHFPGIAVVGRFNITPAQYRELLKEHGK
jgi:hypothetical protein